MTVKVTAAGVVHEATNERDVLRALVGVVDDGSHKPFGALLPDANIRIHI